MTALHQHFEGAVDDAPDRLVLAAGSRELTARQLDETANRIAWSLIERGVTRGDLVGVALHRNISLVPSLLGVLKCGAAYVPIDPHLPDDRIASMLDDAGVRQVLVARAAEHAGPYASRACLDPSDLDRLSNNRTRPHLDVGSADAAYVIYTSGTTGRPKGVVVEHRSADNLARAWKEVIPFKAGATISSLATVAFDIFLAETILPMVYGLRVALATDTDVASPTAIARFLAREQVDAMQVTPSRLSWLLADEDVARELARVELLIVGGEAFPPMLLEQARTHTQASVFNVYGPTEATVWTSAKQLDVNHPITIGKPIVGVGYHVLSESGAEAALGEPGELYISGAALARGYLGDQAKTDVQFVSRPDIADGRLYRTGDLARRCGDGEVQIVGRTDHQVKIDGYRVELAEVEAVLAETSGVRDAVVTMLDGGASRTLAALVTPASADTDAAWAHAATRLPRYMMPSTVVAIDALPMSAAGKADRRMIGALLSDHVRHTADADPHDYLYATIARWLGHTFDPDAAGLIDLGVGSLNTARLTAEISCRYGARLSLADVIAAPSVRELASLVRAHRR